MPRSPITPPSPRTTRSVSTGKAAAYYLAPDNPPARTNAATVSLSIDPYPLPGWFEIWRSEDLRAWTFCFATNTSATSWQLPALAEREFFKARFRDASGAVSPWSVKR